MTDTKQAVQTKTFLEYREYELYDSYLAAVQVTTRDVKQLDFAKLFNDGFPPTALGFPIEFRFYDADVSADGREVAGTRRNYSKDYEVADIVMSLDDYKKREAPKLAQYKQDKVGRVSAFMNKFWDGGFSLTRSFKAALGPKKPVMDWYIRAVEAAIDDAQKSGVTHMALRSSHESTTPVPVTANTVVLDKQLNQLHPAATQPTASKSAPRP